MSALNKVMEYLGLVDGPEGNAEEVKPVVTKSRDVRVVAPVTTPTTTATGVTVLGGRSVVESQPMIDLEPSYNIVTSSTFIFRGSPDGRALSPRKSCHHQS